MNPPSPPSQAPTRHNQPIASVLHASHARPIDLSPGYPRVQVITGPMCCGKSAELIRRIRLALRARLGVRVFRPLLDTRVPSQRIRSRDRSTVEAIPIVSPFEIFHHIDATVSVIGIDEAQFFDERIVEVVRTLSDEGRTLIVAGLELDFAEQPFGPMPLLLAVADTVDKLTAMCQRCRSFFANRTQRLVAIPVGSRLEWRPARADDEQVIVDHSLERVKYEPRCKRCFELPRAGVDVPMQLTI